MTNASAAELSWTASALRVLALRLRHEVALTRTLRGDGRQEGFLGLLLSADEAEAMLTEASGRLRASGTALAATALAELDQQLAEERHMNTVDPFCTLVRSLGFDDVSADLLLLAAAPALDARFGAVYGYLGDDMSRRHLTPELAVRLLDAHDATLAAVRSLLAPGAPLIVTGVLRVAEQQPWIQAPVRIDDLLLDRLLGIDSGSATSPVNGWGIRIPLAPAPAAGEPALAPGIWLTDASPAGSLPALTAAHGMGRGVLLLEAAAYAGPDADLVPLLRSALREATLSNLLPVLTGFERFPTHILRSAAAALRPPAVVVTTDRTTWQDAQLTWEVLRAAPPARERVLRWLLAGHRADSPGLRQWLAGLQRLDPLVVGRLLATAPTGDQLRRAVRDRLGQPLTRLAEELHSGYTLADLVLPARTGAALRELADWHATGPRVREQWGYGQVFGRGEGTTALFKGPSGTGKTMAAAALGNALDLPVFRVNLAGLVSKYIGETEKNLDELFDAADGSDVVLFFDEADAIFGKRSEVHDAHDRYANLETAYLLQRIERHAGISILASNLHQNIDEAFGRRLDLVIDFPTPSPASRQRIWQRMHRGGAPLASDIDFGLLAERFELTGGQIRNSALAAAHLAATDGGVITMDALMRAVARELAKTGKPIRRAEFGEHYVRSRRPGN